MAYIEPNSTIILLGGVPFDPSYEDTMFFATPEDQYNYFAVDNNGLRRTVLEDYSYSRNSRNSIKVELPIISTYGVNYMMYRNTSFENKWFFAFITKVEYINNITTEIFFEIDVIQSWLFDMDFNECWIERQHTVLDRIGETLTDEGLETGEYVIQQESYVNEEPAIVVAATMRYDSNDDKFIPAEGEDMFGRGGDSVSGGKYYTGTTFVVYPLTDYAQLNADLEEFTNKNKIGAIISIFMGAKAVFQRTNTTNPNSGALLDPIVTSVVTPKKSGTGAGTLGYWIDDHPVRNKKLLQYPFNFLQISNMQGENLDLHYEYFTDPTSINLSRFGNKSTNPGILLWPRNYKGYASNYEECISVQSFPLCSFNNDTYKAWLAQNKGTLTAAWLAIGAQGGVGIGNIAAGVDYPRNRKQATKAELEEGGKLISKGTKELIGSLAAAGALLGRMYDHSTLPTTQHGSGNGDLMYQSALNEFGVYHKCITKYYAEKIDTYFDMYGYKVSKCGIPQMNVRPCWTYVKTAGCSLKSKDPLLGYYDIPADDARAIESLFDKGIRFWKTNATFGVFGYPNNNQPTS